MAYELTFNLMSIAWRRLEHSDANRSMMFIIGV